MPGKDIIPGPTEIIQHRENKVGLDELMRMMSRTDYNLTITY